MATNTVELKYQKSKAKKAAIELIDRCEKEFRDLTATEASLFDKLSNQVLELDRRIQALEMLEPDPGDEHADPDVVGTGARNRRSSFPIPIGGGNSDFYDNGGIKGFNLGKAVRSMLEEGRLGDREAETSTRLARSQNKSLRPNSFMFPWRSGEKRSLTTSTGAGSVMTVTEQDDFIDIQRRKTIADQLGVTYMENLYGNIRIPRKTGSGTVAWISEGSAVSPCNQTIDYVSLVPKTLACQTIWTRKFLMESGIDVNKFVVDDLTATMARELDRVVFNGSGSGAEPLGLLQDSDLPLITMGVNGGPFTWTNLTQCEQTLLEANGVVNPAKVAFVTSPAGQRYLKSTPRIGSTFPSYLVDEDGKVLGNYPLVASNVIPINLTHGSGSSLTAAVLGDFSQLLVGHWANGFTVVIDDYTRAGYGEIVVTALFDMDTARRHAPSFVGFVGVSAS